MRYGRSVLVEGSKSAVPETSAEVIADQKRHYDAFAQLVAEVLAEPANADKAQMLQALVGNAYSSAYVTQDWSNRYNGNLANDPWVLDLAQRGLLSTEGQRIESVAYIIIRHIVDLSGGRYNIGPFRPVDEVTWNRVLGISNPDPYAAAEIAYIVSKCR